MIIFSSALVSGTIAGVLTDLGAAHLAAAIAAGGAVCGGMITLLNTLLPGSRLGRSSPWRRPPHGWPDNLETDEHLLCQVC